MYTYGRIMSRSSLDFLLSSFHVSYYDVARLAHVAGLETHIGAVFRK